VSTKTESKAAVSDLTRASTHLFSRVISACVAASDFCAWLFFGVCADVRTAVVCVSLMSLPMRIVDSTSAGRQGSAVWKITYVCTLCGTFLLFKVQAAQGVATMNKKRRAAKKHMGSSIDDFLRDEGIFEEAQAQAIKEIKLDVAVTRAAAILQKHMGSLAPPKAKAMLKDLHKLAVKSSRSAAR
jgi:hypothetical protein